MSKMTTLAKGNYACKLKGLREPGMVYLTSVQASISADHR